MIHDFLLVRQFERVGRKNDIPHLLKVMRDLIKMQKGEDMTPELAHDVLILSNCPDYVTGRGHEYGSSLSDEDKRAQIEFLKQM